jgi:pimeloyl-ACP methyl ester carboxylesterase
LDLCFGEQLAAGHRIRLVSFDRPGYGGSTPAPFGLAAIGADAHAVADDLGVGRFATLGFSGGGPGALAAAAVPGGRVTRVGIASGAGPFRLVPGALDELDDNDRAALSLLPDDPAAAASAFAARFEPLAELSRGPGSSGVLSALPICCLPATVSCSMTSDTPRRSLTPCVRASGREPAALAGTTSPGSGIGTST